MNIKEYVKIQTELCSNILMKELFIKINNKFNPIIIKETEVKYNTVSNIKEKNDNFIKRKVRVHIDVNKTSIGLIDIDNYGIKLPNNKYLEFAMVENGICYYYNRELERVYYKEYNSRIVKLITIDNYREHKANIAFMNDYIWREEKFMPRFS